MTRLRRPGPRPGVATKRALVVALTAATLLVAACSSSPGKAGAPASATPTSGATLSHAAAAARSLLPASIKSSGVITVGASFDYPPIIDANVNNPSVPQGVAPDLANALGTVLGVKFQFINTAWPGQLPGLASGKFDVLWGEVSDTAAREKTIADMVPYFLALEGFLLPKGNPRHLTGFDSACGLTIGVPIGSIEDTIIAGTNNTYCGPHGLKAIKIANYQNTAATVTALQSGQVDAVSLGYMGCSAYVKADPNQFAAIEVPRDQTSPYETNLDAVAINKDTPGLSKAIAMGLADLAQSGQFAAILSKLDVSSGMLDPSEIAVNPTTRTPAGTSS
jgi:polar amino acid transport system substrate-binding protein